MVLMLATVIFSGIVVSTLLLLLGLRSMQTRYALSVIAAYVVFFALVGLWLTYVRRVMVASRVASARRPRGRGIRPCRPDARSMIEAFRLCVVGKG